MKDQFVTYEIALKLKELGFDEPCFAFYDIENENKLKPIPMLEEINSFNSNNNTFMVSAPLWQQAIDWLRENHNIYVCFYRGEFGWHYSIQKKKMDTIYENCLEPFFVIREQAILKAIELISINGKV